MNTSVETLAIKDLQDPGDWKTHGRSQWRQTLTAIVVNILSFSAGIAYGWAAPILPLLQSEDSPIGIPPITDFEASWLASVVALSRIVAIPVYTYTNDRFGRKMTGYLVAAPFIVGGVLMLFANSFVLLLTVRVLNGLGAGGTAVIIPAYVGDIASDDVKGQIGTIFGLQATTGMLFAYAMGSYTSYIIFNLCCLLLPILFVVAFFWFPESPLFLLTRGDEEEAKKNLRWLRNRESNESELERLRLRAKDILERKERKISLSSITQRSNMRSLLICVGLVVNQQMSGAAAIASYTVSIFQQAGSTIHPNVATIIYGSVQVAGTLISAFVIERCGRRFLLLFSDIMMTVSLAVLGAYFYLKTLGWNLEYVGWIPVTSLSIYILSVGIGLGPLPFSIITELVSSENLGLVQCITLLVWSLLSFGMMQVFTNMKNAIGLYGCFWLFSGVCAISSACIFFTVPETKNRSLEEVVGQMKGSKYIKSVIYYNSTV